MRGATARSGSTSRPTPVPRALAPSPLPVRPSPSIKRRRRVRIRLRRRICRCLDPEATAVPSMCRPATGARGRRHPTRRGSASRLARAAVEAAQSDSPWPRTTARRAAAHSPLPARRSPSIKPRRRPDRARIRLRRQVSRLVRAPVLERRCRCPRLAAAGGARQATPRGSRSRLVRLAPATDPSSSASPRILAPHAAAPSPSRAKRSRSTRRRCRAHTRSTRPVSRSHRQRVLAARSTCRQTVAARGPQRATPHGSRSRPGRAATAAGPSNSASRQTPARRAAAH